MRIKKLIATFTMVTLALIAGCKKDNFNEIIGKCPAVEFTSPAKGATGVSQAKIITVTFNEAMNPATINQASFQIKGTSLIAGTISYSGITATFIPTDSLLPNTTYTGRITTAVKDPAGMAIQEDYVWTFSTGLFIAPLVISTDPADNETSVVLNKHVTAKFNIPMNGLTINDSTFTVKQGLTPVAGTVQYTDTTATFIPQVNLASNTTYTATITTKAKSSSGVAIASDYIWSFTTANTIAPYVIATDPVHNETGVAQNKLVKATFSTRMKAATLNTTTFTLKQGVNVVTGVVSYTDSTATFTPDVLLIVNTVYTGTITTGAQNLAGIPMGNSYSWTFTTIAPLVPPTVISTDPLNNATGIPLNKIVAATFSVPMDPLTISTSTFTVKQGITPVTGVVSYSGSTATFNPSANFVSGMVYTATITTGAKNLAGTPLANDYVWTFTAAVALPPTVISTDPVNLATNVALNKVITATFSTAMDPLTITTLTFTVKQGTTSVSGVVSYSGSTATFTPSANLLSGNTYTATITTGAKNVAGTPLANDYVWNFSTTPPAGPAGVDLKSVGRFGIIAGVGVSNAAGQSEIHDMDVGISPGVRSSITGFPPAIIVNGAMYASDDIAPPGVPAMLTQAKQDLTDAYLFAEGATSPAPATVSGDQGGKTLAPGIYKSTSTLLIQSGDLTLDAQGDVNAVWIFQIAAGFTTVGGAGGNVILTGGAQAKNVFWQTGSSATIGDGTSFKGTILALTSITMNSGATAQGRMLARNGSVVLTSTNIITKP